jgi:hypothetical protein
VKRHPRPRARVARRREVSPESPDNPDAGGDL